MRRTDRRPLARPRSIASPKAGCFFRRSIVRVLTLKNEATSASVHCSPHSFSSSTRLMFTALRPAPGRAPPVMLLLSLADVLGFPLLAAPRCDSYSRSLPLRGDLVESATVAVESGQPAQFLQFHQVDVYRPAAGPGARSTGHAPPFACRCPRLPASRRTQVRFIQPLAAAPRREAGS